MTDGIIVARFQVPVLPEPLKELLLAILGRHRRVALVLGEAAIPGSRNNPLSVDSRKAMIQADFPDLEIFSLRDQPSDNAWSDQLDALLEENGFTEVIIYGTEAGFRKRYAGKFPTAGFPHEPVKAEVDITEIPESRDFRVGRIHAFQSAYPKVYPTVDIALFRQNRSELLLGRKSNDGSWRLPGGFTDPTDESYEAAALRELREETGEYKLSALAIEGSFRIDDWRYRYEQDKIITTLFSADHISGEPGAGDDLAEVRWFSLEAVQGLIERSETVSEHDIMLKFLLGKYL